MNKRFITINRGDTVLTVEGYLDPPDYEVGWNGDFVIEKIRVETDTDITDLLADKVLDDICEECFEYVMDY